MQNEAEIKCHRLKIQREEMVSIWEDLARFFEDRSWPSEPEDSGKRVEKGTLQAGRTTCIMAWMTGHAQETVAQFGWNAAGVKPMRRSWEHGLLWLGHSGMAEATLDADRSAWLVPAYLTYVQAGLGVEFGQFWCGGKTN